MYSKKLNSTNTNITVEKIDTTETYTKNTQTQKTKIPIQKSHNENAKREKKNKEKAIQNHLESLDELSLVLTNVSENCVHSFVDTETLINRSEKTKQTKQTKQTKKIKNKKNSITLQFTKNSEVNNLKYIIINKYVKKNIESITNLLYDKKLIKQKNIPYRILFHIYVNYLNNDMKIIFT
jgi:hypothetical protein